MGEKRLDFAAPLLSVRRIAAKTEHGAETVGNPGLIPFTWEQSPGIPKGPAFARSPTVPKLPPGRILPENDEKKVKERDDGDAFVDQVETFSRSDSSLDCSVSGCGSSDALEPSESFSKDPEVHEFMMGRFLPAAKAMATGPLETAAPKDAQRFTERASYVNCRRLPVPLPYQHRPSIVSKFAYHREEVQNYVEEDEGKEDYGGVSHFSRACGLIPQFCLKNSFLLLNPVPGMKMQSHFPPRSQTNSYHESLTGDSDESWDAVYKYNIGHRDDPLEDGSKLTSESNQLTSWRDSQTLDESSYYHSPQSPFREGKGSLGVLGRELKGRKTVSFDSCERFGQKYGKSRPRHGKRQGSVSMSPSTGGTLYVDSNSSSVDDVADTADKNFGPVVDVWRTDDNFVLEICKKKELQPKISQSAEADLSSRTEQANFEEMNCSINGQLALKVEDKEMYASGLALSVLPPPLPKSPSESWLQRTLPSVSSKYSSSQSLLGIHVHHRKQASCTSSKDFKCANDLGTESIASENQVCRGT